MWHACSIALLIVLHMDASKSITSNSNLPSHPIGLSITHQTKHRAYIYNMVHYLEVHTDCTYISCSEITFGWITFEISKVKNIFRLSMAKRVNLGNVCIHVGTWLWISSEFYARGYDRISQILWLLCHLSSPPLLSEHSYVIVTIILDEIFTYYLRNDL